MPPRRSARLTAVTERATTALAPLPLPIVLRIFGLLPVDTRLRCAEVCRGWRSVLQERSLWTHLDLSEAGGVRVSPHLRDFWGALVTCAAERAAGGLQSLQVVATLPPWQKQILHASLMQAVTANAASLRFLHVTHEIDLGSGLQSEERCEALDLAQVETLLQAAPELRVFSTNVLAKDEDELLTPEDRERLRRALRNEPPFAPLRLRQLSVFFNGDEAEATVVAFAADLAAHASLESLWFDSAPLGTPAALNAVVDAALARRMHTIELVGCEISHASAPTLARLLGGSALTTLCCKYGKPLDAPAAAVLAAALRANSTLTSLSLCASSVFDGDAAAGVELLGALTAHPSLHTLNLQSNELDPDFLDADDRAAVGAALGALVAANAPALTELDVSDCGFCDDDLRPLIEALPHNTHLCVLDCSGDLSDAFDRDVVLPAVRANTSLRKLATGGIYGPSNEAEELVSSRAAV